MKLSWFCFWFLSCLHVWSRKASSRSLSGSGQGELLSPGGSLTCSGRSDLRTLRWHRRQTRPFFRRNRMRRNLGGVWLPCSRYRATEDHFLQVNSNCFLLFRTFLKWLECTLMFPCLSCVLEEHGHLKTCERCNFLQVRGVFTET